MEQPGILDDIEARLMIPDYLYESLPPEGIELVSVAFKSIKEETEGLKVKLGEKFNSVMITELFKLISLGLKKFDEKFLIFSEENNTELSKTYAKISQIYAKLKQDIKKIDPYFEMGSLNLQYIFRKPEIIHLPLQAYLEHGGDPDTLQPVVEICHAFSDIVFVICPETPPNPEESS